MSVIERPAGEGALASPAEDTGRDRTLETGAQQRVQHPEGGPDRPSGTGSNGSSGRAVLPRGDPPGLRIRRIRIPSVMAIASVFFVLGYVVTLATLVVLWNVALNLEMVADLEELVRSSLGLEEFDVVGQELFDLAVVGFAVVFGLGLVITVLLALVYNATSVLFGGLALETGPLRRTRRVFSVRHRAFVDVR
jgi:hypothetical protein